MDLGAHFLENSRREFRGIKALADKAIGQLDDAQFFAAPDAESNSVAINVKHVAGNLRSRWTNFLTTDGEKPDRRRDTEFEVAPEDTRAALLERWEAGWGVLFASFDLLVPADCLRTVIIRGEAHTVVQAVHRQMTHYGYHVGQIVFLAKHHRVTSWHTLSVPRNQSAAFNARMQEKFGKK